MSRQRKGRAPSAHAPALAACDVCKPLAPGAHTRLARRVPAARSILERGPRVDSFQLPTPIVRHAGEEASLRARTLSICPVQRNNAPPIKSFRPWADQGVVGRERQRAPRGAERTSLSSGADD